MAAAGINVGDSRSPRVSPRGYMNSTVQESNKHLGKHEKMRRLQPTRDLARKFEARQMPSRRATVSPREPTTSNNIFSAVHTSAPLERARFRPEGITVRDRAASKLKERQDLRHTLSLNRESSPRSLRPTSRNVSRTTATTAPSVVPDYSALRSLPSVMQQGRKVLPSVDFAYDTVSNSVGQYNKINNGASRDSVAQNNIASMDNNKSTETLSFKIRGPISAGVATDSRREHKPLSVKSPVPSSQFMFDMERTEASSTDSPTCFPMQRTPSVKSTNSSSGTITFWSKMQSHPGRSSQRGANPLSCGTTSSGDQSDLVEDSVRHFDRFEHCPSSAFSQDGSEKYDHHFTTGSRYFGISFGRRKSKNYDSASLKSGDEPDSATSVKKRKMKKLTKVMRRIGKALNKRLLQSEGAKPANLQNIIQNRLGSMKSVSSDNTSETCSSIDMDEMKTANPQLYSTILETVASWCDGPTVEPEDKTDALSSRTLSSISFCEKSPRASQDLTNFETDAALKAEEAFLSDVVEGRIKVTSSDTSSIAGSVSEKEGTCGASLEASGPEESEKKEGKKEKVCPVDAVPEAGNGTNTAPEESSSANRKRPTSPLPPAIFYLTDSESDDDELEERKDPTNDFLHLTSSELESMDMSSLQEVLKMQGIWQFNWDRCAEIKLLSEEWKKSACLQKYTDGGYGMEIAVDDGIVKCYRSPLPDDDQEPMERVYLDAAPPPGTSSTLNVKGTLTSMGLRTTCRFPSDGSRRNELVWIERDGLCIQVTSELASGERNVSRVYLKRSIIVPDY